MSKIPSYFSKTFVFRLGQTVFPAIILAMILLTFVRPADAQLGLDATYNAGVTDSFANVYVSKPLADGKILVGGSFRTVNGVEKNGLARLNADGSLDSTFVGGITSAGSLVYEITQLSDGKFLIGGSFSTYNDVFKSGIVRLNADGSLDSTFNNGGDGLTGTVQTIALQPDGKILISGSSISAYNGVTRFSVIRLNADGTLDTNFTSPFVSSQFVEEVDVQADGKIMIAGVFGIGSPFHYDVARLNANGSFDTTFNASGIGTDNGGVYAMTIQADGKILIGGAFKSYNGTPRAGLARLNTDGTLDAAFSPNVSIGIDGAEYFLLQADGKILVAGGFGSVSLNIGLIRLNTNGSLDTTFTSNVTNGVGYQIAAQTDGKLFLSGLFNTVNGIPHRNLIKLSSEGVVDNSFNPTFGAFSLVNALALQTDGKTVAAGTFNFANGISRPNITRFNVDGTVDNSFDSGTGTFPDPNNSANAIYDVAVQTDGKILAGGNFGGYRDSLQVAIARINTDGTLDTSFSSPLSNYLSTFVYDVFVQPDGKILLGGVFTDANFNSQFLIRLNSNGSLDTTFTGNPNGTVRSISKQSDGKILVGGAFTLYSGTSRNRFARLNADGTLDPTFNPGTGFSGTVLDSVQQPDGKILVAGAFTLLNGVSSNRIARLNANGTQDTSFNSGVAANGTVYSIALQTDGKILIGGFFSTFGSSAGNRLARLNADGSFDATFVSGFDNDPRFSVRRLVTQADGKILVGGTFKTYNGAVHNGLVRLGTRASRPGFFDFDGDGKSDLSVFRPANATWYVSNSTNGFTATPWGNSTDKLVPADYDGDGKIETAVYRDGYWYILRSSDKQIVQISFGTPEDIPVPADFDGDGKADISIYRPSNSVWYRLNSTDGGFVASNWGAVGDKPVIGDFDGDGKADLTVYRPSNNVWYRLNSSNSQFVAVSFGASDDLLVPADYDGDGKTDIAVYRPSNSTWYRLSSADGSFAAVNWGISTDKPVPADYDGDGKTDVAVYRDGKWYIVQSTNGQIGYGNFGGAGDIPIPNVYVK